MTKKQFLELLITTYGLEPKDVRNYRTAGCEGQFKVGMGWEGAGVDKDGVAIIRFAEPDGFNMAVHEILRQAYENELTPWYVPGTI